MPPNNQTPAIPDVPKKPHADAVPQDAPAIIIPSSHVVMDHVPIETAFDAPEPIATPMAHTTMTPSTPAPSPAPLPAPAPIPAIVTPPSSVSATPVTVSPATPVPPPPLSRAEQAALLTQNIADISARKEAMRTEIASLSVEQKKEEALLAPLLKKENDIKAEHEAIEKNEASATNTADKRKFEVERFEQETKLQAFLVEKFAAMEKSEKIKESIAEKEATYQSLVSEETQLKTRVHELEVESERKVIHDELEGVVKSRGETERKLGEVTKEKVNAERLLNETTEKEKSIEESAHATREAMNAAGTLQDERTLAETRAKLEAERHRIEEERWKAEDAVAAINTKEAEATKALEDIKAHEAELFAKLQTIK
jgi:chromosome segregation ATPase